MKLAAAITALLISGVAAFAPSTPTFVDFDRDVAATARTTTLFGRPDEEEGGLDLNLEEMFDMFDAADKGEDFDKTIKVVKKEKDKPDEEEGGLDLNLEEMFDMFDAADKGGDFEEAMKEVKKEKVE